MQDDADEVNQVASRELRGPSDRPDQRNVGFAEAALALVTLSVLAVGLPIVATLGNGPTFFVAHRAPTSQILLALLLVVAIPALVAILVLSLGWAVPRRRGRTLTAIALITALSGFLVVQQLSRIMESIVLTAIIAAASAFIAGFSYLRLSIVRRVLRELAFGTLVIPAWFVFMSPASGLFAFGSNDSETVLRVENPIPVTIVVFDEFHTAAILDRNGEVDVERFPNFGRLAADSTWYPNGVANVEQTVRAIPTILTGVVQPVRGVAPTSANYPNNILTALSATFDIRSVELVTDFCQPNVCAGQINTLQFDSTLYLGDLVAITRVAVWPAGSGSTQELGVRWRGFSDSQASSTDATFVDQGFNDLKEALDSIAERPSNQINFFHIFEPKIPYDRFSDGRTYGLFEYLPPGIESESAGWGSDQNLIENAYLRYLHQVGFADLLLGKVLDALDSASLYEETLLIVTADHGVAFTPGESRRLVQSQNAREIINVPFFIRGPAALGINRANRVEAPISHVDIVPTIADAIGAELSWQADGISALRDEISRRETIPLALQNFNNGRAYETDLSEFQASNRLENQLASFGDRSSLGDVTRRTGLYHDLVGRRVSEFSVRESEMLFELLSGPVGYAAVRNREAFVPRLLRGTLQSEAAEEENLHLAISLDGHIVAVAQTSKWMHSEYFWETLIPESDFPENWTLLEVFVASHCERLDEDCFLLKLEAKGEGLSTPDLVLAEDGPAIRIGERKWSIQESLGYVGSVSHESGVATFSGWASQPHTFAPPAGIAVFSGEDGLLSNAWFFPRKDVEAHLGLDRRQPGEIEPQFGWSVVVALSDAVLAGQNIKFFAMYPDGTAGEVLGRTEPYVDGLRRAANNLFGGSEVEISQSEIRVGEKTFRRNAHLGSIDQKMTHFDSHSIRGWFAHADSCFGPSAILLVENNYALELSKSEFVSRRDVLQALAHQFGTSCDALRHGFQVTVESGATQAGSLDLVAVFSDRTAAVYSVR